MAWWPSILIYWPIFDEANWLLFKIQFYIFFLFLKSSYPVFSFDMHLRNTFLHFPLCLLSPQKLGCPCLGSLIYPQNMPMMCWYWTNYCCFLWLLRMKFSLHIYVLGIYAIDSPLQWVDEGRLVVLSEFLNGVEGLDRSSLLCCLHSFVECYLSCLPVIRYPIVLPMDYSVVSSLLCCCIRREDWL